MTAVATERGFDRRLIAPMVLGSILNPINSSIIAVSLTPIGIAFGADPSATAWLVSSLYLATAIGQPVVGRLVDLYGPRPLYLGGTALIAVGGLLGTLAPSLGVLVLARVLLGFGTCAGYPASMYLIRSEARRTGQDSPGGVLTTLAVASQTVAAVGPTLGGLLIGLGGWRATFAINVPLAIACLVMGSLRLSRDLRPARDADAPRLDVVGSVLFAGALVSLLLFLMHPHVGSTYLLAIGAVVGAVFVRWELRAPGPFVDLRLLGGNLPLVRTYLRTFAAQLVAYCFLYGYTQWLEQGRGLSATHTGLILLPMFGVAIGVSTLTGRSPELRRKLTVGAIVQIAACLLLLLLTGSAPIWLLIAGAVLLGVPQGLNNLANQNAVYHQADPERVGSSAGLLRTFVYLGAIGSSAASGVFLKGGADTAGLHHLALFMLAAGAVFLALTLTDRSLSHVADHPDTQEPR